MKCIFIYKNGAIKVDTCVSAKPLIYECDSPQLGCVNTTPEDNLLSTQKNSQKTFIGRKISGHSHEEICIYVEK